MDEERLVAPPGKKEWPGVQALTLGLQCPTPISCHVSAHPLNTGTFTDYVCFTFSPVKWQPQTTDREVLRC